MAQTRVTHTTGQRHGDERNLGCYVYGIMWAEAVPALLATTGIDPASPVYALPKGDLAAIVSDVPLSEYEREPLKQRLSDMAWVEARVRAHAAIVGALCRSATMVPMRFCTIFRSEGRVCEMLIEHRGYFAEALTRFAGKHEWGVKLTVDRERLAQAVGDCRDAIRDLKTELAAQPPGAAYLGRKRLERAVADAVTEAIDECAGRSHERLGACAEEAVVLDGEAPLATDPRHELALNAAYLVSQTRLAEFRSELDRLCEEYTRLGFRYEPTGPWPPYSFVGAPDE
ncbi:MAG: GvpL/GvpF family gas vesicle protein [Armatimonadetes bacterium]|nr:GvpL/GvpF family gas vesicle protein [Armatimonadota bacterium]